MSSMAARSASLSLASLPPATGIEVVIWTTYAATSVGHAARLTTISVASRVLSTARLMSALVWMWPWCDLPLGAIDSSLDVEMLRSWSSLRAIAASDHGWVSRYVCRTGAGRGTLPPAAAPDCRRPMRRPVSAWLARGALPVLARMISTRVFPLQRSSEERATRRQRGRNADDTSGRIDTRAGRRADARRPTCRRAEARRHLGGGRDCARRRLRRASGPAPQSREGHVRARQLRRYV